ncbi:MAG: GntR family transcriptional regulator, partial [Pseudomonadota bacterium]
EDGYRDLKRRILTLQLEPGADLDEVTLSAEYGLSRTPLREILQRLAGEGYVQLASHRGAKVASMDITALRTFFQTAPMIYSAIARLAAENHKVSELTALGEVQNTFREALSATNAEEAALANHAFHAGIGGMAKNPYLAACLDRLLIDHTRLGRSFYQPRAPQEQELIDKALVQHDQMIEAFKARDADRAVALTLEHWDLSRDRIERFVRPDPLPIDGRDVAHAI